MSKLQDRRKAAGYSQSQLAAITGASYRLLQQLEGGQRDISGCKLETLARISIALKCQISDILEDDKLIELLKITKL